MSIPTDLRSRKRLATRQSISNAATRLFLERGFDYVTVDEIAAAADVGRMTVFNHFPPQGGHVLRPRRGRPRDAARHIAPARSAGGRRSRPCACWRTGWWRSTVPYVSFTAASQGFVETIEGSETLKARARAIRNELWQLVAQALWESAGREADDADAHLAAGLLLATWTVALVQAHRIYRHSRDTAAAQAAFLGDRGQGQHRHRSRRGGHALRVSGHRVR